MVPRTDMEDPGDVVNHNRGQMRFRRGLVQNFTRYQSVFE